MKILDWNEYDERPDEENMAETIKEKVGLLDVLDELDVEYIGYYGSPWTHKLRCPFEFHQGGNERTPSMYLSGIENRFKCFGCQAGGNVISFVMNYYQTPYREAVKWLINFGEVESDPNSEFAPRKRKNRQESSDFQALKIANLLRKHLESNPNDNLKGKVDRVFNKIDILLKEGDDKWEDMAAYHEKLKNKIGGKK